MTYVKLVTRQEVMFSCKMTKTNHPTLNFDGNLAHQVALQKHHEMFLDSKLNFEQHYKTIVNKVNKTARLLRKCQNFFRRKSLITIYKSFIRPHLDYSDITHDQSYIILLSIKDWNHFNTIQEKKL